jgi:hypothetical protein
VAGTVVGGSGFSVIAGTTVGAEVGAAVALVCAVGDGGTNAVDVGGGLVGSRTVVGVSADVVGVAGGAALLHAASANASVKPNALIRLRTVLYSHVNVAELVALRRWPARISALSRPILGA